MANHRYKLFLRLIAHEILITKFYYRTNARMLYFFSATWMAVITLLTCARPFSIGVFSQSRVSIAWNWDGYVYFLAWRLMVQEGLPLIVVLKVIFLRQKMHLYSWLTTFWFWCAFAIFESKVPNSDCHFSESVRKKQKLNPILWLPGYPID